MEYVLNNNTDLLKLKEMFTSMSIEEHDKPVIEELEEEENSLQTDESEIEEEMIPESFEKDDLDIELIPTKLLEKKLCKEFLKEEDKCELLLYYYNDKENVVNDRVEEKYNEIERRIYYYFYKLLQSEEWEEILYEKMIESNLSKDLFLYYFSYQGKMNGLSFKEDTKHKFKDLVHSLFEEIDW